jgi:hypothetical protein
MSRESMSVNFRLWRGVRPIEEKGDYFLEGLLADVYRAMDPVTWL